MDEARKSVLRFFNRRWPDAKSNDTVMLSGGKRTVISKIFIERNDERLIPHSPGENGFVRPSREAYIVRMVDEPSRLDMAEPRSDCAGNVLVEENG
ncbi:MAG: hypothetical protein P0111_17735 [Nitrospira sp.]|nr:hypothetical protein [Nitrospira sp.]